MSQGSSNPTTDLKKIGGVPVDVNSGNASTGTQRVVIASDQVALPITDNGGSLTVDGTVSLSSGSLSALETITANQGGAWTVAATQSGTWNINTLTGITNTVTVDGTVSLSTATLNALETINAVQSGTWNIGTVTTVTGITNVVSVDDNGGSLTVDAPVTTPAFVRLSDGTDPVDILPVSQSGTWNIGTVASITNDVNIADGGNSITVDDGGLALTVDGTVSLSAGTLSALETINAVQSGTWNINNISGTISLPTGAATSANQSTIIGHVDGIETLLGTIDEDTGAIRTSVGVLDNAVVTDGAAAATSAFQIAGTDGVNSQIIATNASGHVLIADGGNAITVDGTVAATQSGTWNIGTVTTLTGITNDVNISDGGNSITVDDGNGSLTVDGIVSLSTSTLTALETINAVQSGTWDIGTVSTVTSITNVVSIDDNGSTISIDDGGGAITVDGTVSVSGTTTVSGTVTLNNQDIHDGAAGTAVSMIGGYASLAAPTAVVDGDAARIWVTRSGAVNIADAGGSITVDDGGNSLTVDGIVTANQGGAWTVTANQGGVWTVAATQSGTWNIGTLTSITNDVNIADGGNSITVDDGGSSLTVDGTVVATQSGTWTVNTSSDDVHDAAAGTTGIMNVGYASSAAPTAVANGDAARFWLTTSGALNIADGGSTISIDDGNSTISIDDGGGAITVDGSVNAVQSGTWNIGTVTTVTGITNVVSVDDNGGSLTVDDGGSSLTVDGIVTANQGGAWTVTVQDGGNSISIDDGGNTITVDGTITANLNGVGSITDNATFSQGTDRIIVAGYLFDETAGTALSENDAGAARINANRAVVNAIEDGATRGRYATVTAANALKVDNSGVTQPVSGTVTVASITNALPSGNNNIGNVDIASALPSGDNNIGNVDVVTLPALPTGSNTIGTVNLSSSSLTALETINAVQSGTWDIGTVTTVSAVTRVNQWNGNTIATGSGSVSTGTLRTVEAGASTGSQTNPSLSTSSATVLAASTARRGATIYNGSTSTLYLRLSATAASTTTYTVRLYPDDYYEVPSYYNGVITGVLDTGSTTAVQVTQIT